METTIVYWCNIGIMENKMETTIMDTSGTASKRRCKSGRRRRARRRGSQGALPFR